MPACSCSVNVIDWVMLHLWITLFTGRFKTVRANLPNAVFSTSGAIGSFVLRWKANESCEPGERKVIVTGMKRCFWYYTSLVILANYRQGTYSTWWHNHVYYWDTTIVQSSILHSRLFTCISHKAYAHTSEFDLTRYGKLCDGFVVQRRRKIAHPLTEFASSRALLCAHFLLQ